MPTRRREAYEKVNRDQRRRHRALVLYAVAVRWKGVGVCVLNGYVYKMRKDKNKLNEKLAEVSVRSE